MLLAIILFVAVGAISGLFSGMLGIGGGIIIVPAMMAILGYFHLAQASQIAHLAIGTSLASAIVNLLSSCYQHNKHKTVRWDVVKIIFPGLILGSLVVGPLLMLFINGSLIELMFGGFCVLLALYMLFNKSTTGTEKLPGPWILRVVGFVIATISTLLGIAGGVLIGALFNIWHMSTKQVVGTNAAVGLPITIPATIGLMMIGWHQANLPSYSVGYIYLPALVSIIVPSLITVPLGVWIAHRVRVSFLKKIFAIVVLAMGLKMLF
jgi:uncharacterized membrane protein YfcA